MRRAFLRGRRIADATSVFLVAVAVITLYVSIIITVPSTRGWVDAATFAEQLLLPVSLAGAAFLGVAWRIRPASCLGWLTAATTMIGIQSAPLLASTSDTQRGAENSLSTSIAVGVTLLLFVKVAERRTLTLDPLVLGVAVGLGILVARGVWSALDLPRARSESALEYASAFLVLIGLVLALAIRRASTMPYGANRLAVAVAVWSMASALGATGRTQDAGWALVAIVAGLIACIFSFSTAVDLLRRAVRDDQESVAHLQQQLGALRGRVEQLHEVKGTIAGIASATDLILHEDRLTSQHRGRLEEMLAQEAARLQRLVHSSTAPRISDLDAIIRPLVLARQVQGLQVDWCAPDIPVIAHTDELAEVVNILLQNAAQHAPGARIRIFTRRKDDALELVVADDGPGVPQELRHRIFDWGYSTRGSSGQGVGLALAQRMMARRGCYLRLDEDHAAGAAFALELKQTAPEVTRGSARLLIS